MDRSAHSVPVQPSPLRPENRIVNALWIGWLSPLEQICMTSFVQQGHAFHLYTYDEISNVPPGVTLKDAGEILPAARVFTNQRGKGKGSFACFSDLFRYKLLLEKGGWWVDTDVFCLRSFDFEAPYVFGAEDKPVASGVIKAPPASPLAQRCFERADRVDHSQVVWNELVEILADGVRDLDLMRYVLPPVNFSPIAWQDVPDFVRGERAFSPPAASHGVHLYNEMWRRHKLDKYATFPASSVFEMLKQRAGLPSEVLAQRPPQPTSWLRRWWPWASAA